LHRKVYLPNMTRKSIPCILFFFTLFYLSGCDNLLREEAFTEEPEVEIDLQEIQERGYLLALVDNTSVSYFIYKGRPMGFEYELLKRLADHLNVSLKIKLVSGIEQAIDMLNKGEGDVLAFPLAITEERKEYLSFTIPQFETSQVLVQKKPANWRMQPPQLVEKKLVRDTTQLVGKEVHVLKGSSFKERMIQLSERMGSGIKIIDASDTTATEALIRQVATGEIKYTVTDQTIAMVNSLYYSNIDINTVVSEPQQIAWGVRTNSQELLNATNEWLQDIKKRGIFRLTHNKYFKNLRTLQARVTSDYSSVSGNKLSPYDSYLKAGAEQIGWDWRLIAAIAYQESNFNPQVESWAGAIGLMQIMPATGDFFGVQDLKDPIQNINVGIKFLKFLDKQWAKTVPDPDERLKFVLASYNVGLSHVIDAQKLARKYGKDPTLWAGNVEYFLSQKSNPKYYRDPVVVVGYCRCDGPINYVREVLERFEEYKLHFNS
jgi:membrane-bound lytic murein transglycosylase F